MYNGVQKALKSDTLTSIEHLIRINMFAWEYSLQRCLWMSLSSARSSESFNSRVIYSYSFTAARNKSMRNGETLTVKIDLEIRVGVE